MPLLGKPVPPARAATPQEPFRHRLAAGVLAAIAAGLLLLFVPGLVVRLQSDQLTATAEVRSVALDDGIVVMLGADSAIAVRYQDAGRDVRLLKGEAFFQVAPDPQRPFRSSARDVEVTVLGTSFNVRLADDGAEVAVMTGVVQVANAGESPAISLQLQPGDWARLGRAGAVERGTVQTDEVAPWLHGQIVARDRAMADVVDELRRYYRGMIVVADDSLARPPRHRRLQSLRSESGALSAIVGAHGGSVRQVSPWLLVARGS